MHLSSTKLVFPWTLGQISNNTDHSGVFQTYQWIPGPFVTTMIIIVMLVFTLMPAVCSVCYHVYYWASTKDADAAVSNWQALVPETSGPITQIQGTGLALKCIGPPSPPSQFYLPA